MPGSCVFGPSITRCPVLFSGNTAPGPMLFTNKLGLEDSAKALLLSAKILPLISTSSTTKSESN